MILGITRFMPKRTKQGQKHYSNLATAQNYLYEKLLHEAKMIVNRNYSGVGKRTNALNKQKSVLLSKIENSLEALLSLLEGSMEVGVHADAYKLLRSKHKSSQKKYKLDKEYLEQKIFHDFQNVSYRIFTSKRVRRMVQCMFPTPRYPEKLDSDDRIRDVEVANVLLNAVVSIYRKNLDTAYSSFLEDDMNRTQQLGHAIVSELRKAAGKPIYT